jgi:hypothetical protein
MHTSLLAEKTANIQPYIVSEGIVGGRTNVSCCIGVDCLLLCQAAVINVGLLVVGLLSVKGCRCAQVSQSVEGLTI